MNKVIEFFRLTSKHLKQHPDRPEVPDDTRRAWALETLNLFNFNTTVTGQAAPNKPLIFVSNHISYMDIPLIWSSIANSSFVAKSEVARWPLIGKAALKCSTIFVQRTSTQSRSLARQELHRQLLENERRIVIFPSGTTQRGFEAQWKKGIFEIAKDLNVPIQPLRLGYSCIDKVAYVGNDFFPLHLLRLSSESQIKASLDFHPPIQINNVFEDLEYCRRWCNGIIGNSPSFLNFDLRGSQRRKTHASL